MSETVKDSFVEKLREVQTALDDEDYSTVVRLAPSLLASSPSDRLTVALKETYAKALLHEDQWDEALQVVVEGASDSDEHMQAVRAYALYRKEDFLAARDASSSNQNYRAMKHIHAQALYNLQETAEAKELYTQLAEEKTSNEDEDDTEEPADTWTNLAAVLASQANPYVAFDEEKELLGPMRELIENGEDFPFDLAYNLASLRLLSSDDYQWTALLERAEQACEDDDEDKALMRQNLEWSRSFWAGTIPSTIDDDSSKKGSSSSAKIQQVHSALSRSALKDYPTAPHPKWTPLQHRLWLYNRAVLELSTNQMDSCLKTCDALQAAVQPLSKTKKKKLSASATRLEVACPAHRLWWESRLAVLRAYAQQQTQGLETCLERMRQDLPEDTAFRDATLCYLQIHQAYLLGTSDETSDDVITQESLLQTKLPDSIRSKPAVLASLAALYQSQGQASKAQQCLEATGNPLALAHFAMAAGDYAKAASLFEPKDESGQDPTLIAQWVQALSHVEPDKAQEEWSKIRSAVVPKMDEENSTHGLELEERKLPRHVTARKTTIAHMEPVATVDTDASKKPQKNRDAILSYRARKREAYIQELQDQGLYRADRPTQPDPERWIPKYERSYNARRRRRQHQQQHRGAQGGFVSEKDAAKLDVLARQAARAAGIVDPKSTAHMVVSSSGVGPRKGGRRR